MRTSTRLWLWMLSTLAAEHCAMGQELVEYELLEGRVAFSVPAAFEQLPEELLQVRYPAANRPAFAFTNAEMTVNVAVGVVPVPFTAQDLEVPTALADLQRSFLSGMPNAVINASEVSSRDGQPFFLLDVWTPAVNTDVRNLMFGTVLDGRLVVITFNCTREVETEWTPRGRQIIDSITFRK